MTAGKRIAHVNLARGFRGGERQTEVLIQALADRQVPQCLVARKGEPLAQRVKALSDVEVIEIAPPFFRAIPQCRDMRVLHVHEAKGGHLVCQVNQCYGVPYVLTRRVDKPPRTSWLNRRLYNKAAAVAGVSSLIARILAARFPRIRPGVIHDAHSALPWSPEAVRNIRQRFEGKFLVGHAAALVDRHKGQMTLIRAMRRLQMECPDIHLMFLGEGEDEAMLRAAAENLPNVHFEGFTDRLGDYLHALDVFAFPSNYEGLGSVILDAMDAGVAVIASDVGGIPDIVSPRETGLLVPPGDDAALAAGITGLYRNSTERERLAAAGKARSSDYSPAAMAEQYLAIYDSITESQ